MEDTFMRLVVGERLAEAEQLAARAAARRAAREAWPPRPSLRALAAPADSRAMRALFSIDLRADRARALDLASLVAAAIGGVALLAALCP